MEAWVILIDENVLITILDDEDSTVTEEKHGACCLQLLTQVIGLTSPHCAVITVLYFLISSFCSILTFGFSFQSGFSCLQFLFENISFFHSFHF